MPRVLKVNYSVRDKKSCLYRQLQTYRKHNVSFVWIKGHAGNAENEVCDKLAVEASQKKDLLDDTGFESGDDENELFNN